MAYIDLEDKPMATMSIGGDLMTFQPSIPKPDDYVAKDAIYKILQNLEEEGMDINEVPNTLIQVRIKEAYNFDENPKTISAYKSQYKKANQFRPNTITSSADDIAKFFRINRQLRPHLSKALAEIGHDKEALKTIVNAAIDDIIDDLLEGL